MKTLFTASNSLFIALLVLFLTPLPNGRVYGLLAGLTLGLKIIQLGVQHFRRDEDHRKSTDDILAVLYFFFGFWHVFSVRYVVLSKLLFPEPDIVIKMFIAEFPDLIGHLGHTLILLANGYLLALVVAIPLGLIIGVNGRLLRIADPYMKVLGPIPPIVYIPYAISLLPTFQSASIAVIFLGAFWPVFGNTIHGVLNIPRNLIDSSKVLNIKGFTLLFKVILPGAMPSICLGANLSLLFSFLMLVAAELIGSSVGVGWYIRHFGTFGDYPRVISGLIFFGLTVTVINWGTGRIQKHLLKWTDAA